MPDPEVIQISWNANPRGQVGPRPRKINLNGRFQFELLDPGSLTIEFKERSPLEAGNTVNGGDIVVAKKSGKFKFRCIIDDATGHHVLDPDDPPPTNGGGEMEVPPSGTV